MEDLRIAFVTGIPAPYREPLFRALAKRPNVKEKVFYCAEGHADVAWSDSSNRERGYDHEFLPNVTPARLRRRTMIGYANFAIWDRLRSFRPDFVVVNGYNQITHWLTFLYCRTHGIPFGLRSDSNIHFDGPEGMGREIRRVLLRALTPHCSAFLAIGTANAEYWRRYGADSERIQHVPYAVDNELVAQLADREAKSDGGMRFLYVGRLVAGKRVDLLLRAFEEVVNHYECSLAIVGDGPERERLEDLQSSKARRHTQWVGRLPYEETLTWYGRSDVFVFPSSFDRWGLVVNEAMAAGLPVIAYEKCGAAIDLVEDGVTGWRLRESEAEELAGLMRRLLEDPVGVRAMGAQARETIADWTYEAAVDGLLSAVTKARPCTEGMRPTLANGFF